MIRKVYEVDPILCPKCGGTMKVIAFIMDFQSVDRIIDHLKFVFVAEMPPPFPLFPSLPSPPCPGCPEIISRNQ